MINKLKRIGILIAFAIFSSYFFGLIFAALISTIKSGIFTDAWGVTFCALLFIWIIVISVSTWAGEDSDIYKWVCGKQ